MLTREENQSVPSMNLLPKTKTKCQRALSSLYKLFTSEGRNPKDICWGVLVVLILGTLLSLIAPISPLLTLPYAHISSAIGYIYFVAWSISFYPQVFLNMSRKTTIGWSPDFAIYNVFGFLYYSVFNLAFFFSQSICNAYKERHGGKDNQVKSNDVLFAVHALILSVIGFAQLVYYDGLERQKISKFCKVSGRRGMSTMSE